MNLSKFHDVINLLVQLPGSIESNAKCLLQLKENVQKALEVLLPCAELEVKIQKINKVTPNFVLISLYVLNKVSEYCSKDSPSNLLSVQQQQKIKVLLQMIFSLGLTPSLLKGVNTALQNKTFQLHLLKLEELTIMESYELMTEVVRSLIQIIPTPSLRALILNHLGDLISALLQVSYAGTLKKPLDNPTSENKDTSKTFVMTEDRYEKLSQDRNEFKVIYHKVVDSIYKPLVIEELLILLAPTKSIESGEIIPPPSWLKKTVSKKLTEYLISPGGVLLVMRAMFESSSDNVDWTKAEILAKLISTVHDNLSEEEFYSRISPQIISLLSTTGAYCMPVAKNCIKNIYQRNPEIAHKYIFDKLFEMFIMCSKPVSENFSGTLVSEDSSSRCIDHLTKCFLSSSKESSVPITVLVKIIKILFKLYVKVAKSAYHHKSAIQDLILDFLSSETDVTRLSFIYNALIFEEPNEEILEMNDDLEFQFGPTGGVQVGKKCHDDHPSVQNSEFQLEFETAGDNVLDLLSERPDYSKPLLSNLFMILLSALSDFHDYKIEMSNSNPDILSVDELIVFLVKISQKKIITIKLLATLAENVQVMETIQEKPEIVFKFVKNLLESKAKDILKGDEENNEDGQDCLGDDLTKEDAEDLFVALAVVDLITVNTKSNSSRWDKCKSLLKPLEIIKKHCQDYQVQYFSEILYNRISTHGAVGGAKKPQIKPFSGEKPFNLSRKNLTVSNGNCAEKNKSVVKEGKQKKNKKLIIEVDDCGKDKSDLGTILEEICSDDVPTRGHAIIQLSKLIREKDPRILARKDYIFSVLKCNLKHEDTYIYLSAINALENLGSIQKPHKIFEVLCEEYTENKKDFSEIQMKIGEVLMRLTRGLGEVAPKYKALLINTFLFGTKSSDEILRVSSLSNLGELLKILGYSVGSIIQEVFICVKCIAMTDKSEMARRAAVMVIQFLLKGITGDSFLVLEGVIRDLFRALLHICKTEKDEITKLHADLALAEINRIVKPSLNRPVKLEKHIGILNLPQ